MISRRGKYFLLLFILLLMVFSCLYFKWSNQTGHSEQLGIVSSSVQFTQTAIHESSNSKWTESATEPVTVHSGSFNLPQTRCSEELGLVDSSFKLTQTVIQESIHSRSSQKESGTYTEPVIVHSDSFQLPQKVVEGVEKFLFFIGWPRSGHTIIAVMLDAHPNIIIGRRFLLFWDVHPANRKLLDKKNVDSKEYLFNELYYNSALSNSREFLSADARAGYDFQMKGTCQGRFTQLQVIGVKEGGWISTAYSQNPKRTQQYYHALVNVTQIPARVLFVIRNPYDMIATALRWSCGDHCDRNLKIEASKDHPYNDSVGLMREARKVFQLTEATQSMIKRCDLNVLQIYNEDFIEDPKHVIQQICSFLEVECSEEFLKQCQDKVSKSLSRSRSTVVWSEDALRLVEKEIKKYQFFHRYSFHS